MKTTISRGASLALIAALALNAAAANAQTIPGGSVNPNAGSTASTPQTTAGDPGYVMLADLNGSEPREALPGNIGPNTPLLTKQQYLQRFPQAGVAGWERARRANGTLCDEAQAILDETAQLQLDFGSAEADYVNLQQIYDALPGKMKRHSAVMAIAQVGSSGALCALSAGLYCIAAIAGGAGNLAGIHGNLKMQLANIQLSQANIRLSRTTIRADMVWARSTTLWVRLAMPGCHLLNPAYGAPTGFNTGTVYANGQ